MLIYKSTIEVKLALLCIWNNHKIEDKENQYSYTNMIKFIFSTKIFRFVKKEKKKVLLKNRTYSEELISKCLYYLIFCIKVFWNYSHGVLKKLVFLVS